MNYFISSDEYFGKYLGQETEEHRKNAYILLCRLQTLIERAKRDNLTFDKNPKTGSHVSGTTNGGWRPKNCPEGAPSSSHKEGKGVDVYDPDGELDNWIMENKHVLPELGLAIEHPSATRGWCHITTRLPKSRNRVFYP